MRAREMSAAESHARQHSRCMDLDVLTTLQVRRDNRIAAIQQESNRIRWMMSCAIWYDGHRLAAKTMVSGRAGMLPF